MPCPISGQLLDELNSLWFSFSYLFEGCLWVNPAWEPSTDIQEIHFETQRPSEIKHRSDILDGLVKYLWVFSFGTKVETCKENKVWKGREYYQKHSGVYRSWYGTDVAGALKVTLVVDGSADTTPRRAWDCQNQQNTFK